MVEDMTDQGGGGVVGFKIPYRAKCRCYFDSPVFQCK